MPSPAPAPRPSGDAPRRARKLRLLPGRPRRRPEESVLFGVLAEHLESFLEDARQDPGQPGLPSFVERELREFLRCGVLAHGFLRVHCHTCGKDELVAFSCKGRGFCPSCGGRRMADTAAHLVDRVAPSRARPPVGVHGPVPRPLPARLRPQALARDVRRLFVCAVLAFLKSRGREQGLLDPESGAVTATQRFGSALNLNLHFHSLVLDGVFHVHPDTSELAFHHVDPPTDLDVARLLELIRHRVLRLLRRRGRLTEDLGIDEDPLALDEPTLAACSAASLQQRVAFGPQRGAPLVRLGAREVRAPIWFPGPRCAAADGFTLHADVRIAARDRDRLERLARYVTRPAIAQERLSLDESGRVVYRLRRPWSDGTTAIAMEPSVLIERLAALVPPPRAHQLVYHGVFAPASALRPWAILHGAPDRSALVTANRSARARRRAGSLPRDGAAQPGDPSGDPVQTIDHDTTSLGAEHPTSSACHHRCGEAPVSTPAERIAARITRVDQDQDAVEPRPGDPLPSRDATHHGPIDLELLHPRRYSWSELLRRVFAEDVLRCPCGARRRIIAAITDPPVVRAILECLGLPADPPAVHPARAPPIDEAFLFA